LLFLGSPTADCTALTACVVRNGAAQFSQEDDFFALAFKETFSHYRLGPTWIVRARDACQQRTSTPKIRIFVKQDCHRALFLSRARALSPQGAPKRASRKHFLFVDLRLMITRLGKCAGLRRSRCTVLDCAGLLALRSASRDAADGFVREKPSLSRIILSKVAFTILPSRAQRALAYPSFTFRLAAKRADSSVRPLVSDFVMCSFVFEHYSFLFSLVIT